MLEFLQHLLRSAYDPEALKELVRTGGAPLVCTIVFIETGFFVGFFLPGDSLLITAGIFAAYRSTIETQLSDARASAERAEDGSEEQARALRDIKRYEAFLAVEA